MSHIILGLLGCVGFVCGVTALVLLMCGLLGVVISGWDRNLMPRIFGGAAAFGFAFLLVWLIVVGPKLL